MALSIGVLDERGNGERRVAVTPEVAAKLAERDASVVLAAGAGLSAGFPDDAYESARVGDATQADLLVSLAPLATEAVSQMPNGKFWLGFVEPHRNTQLVRTLADKKTTVFAMELIPRITRAQSMDALSSQAAVAGYQCALIAARCCPKFFPMLTTAAGTVRPSRVLIIGAGVAGLQAIATAKRLGAIVEGYDVRPETSEQIESLGARFLDLGVSAAGEGGYARELTDEEKQAQQDALAEHLATLDVVITTAAIPGRPAPKIITRSMAEGMKPGSVIVDMAAAGGGNCELTQPGQTIEHKGVTIVGPLNLPSDSPADASSMYARNIFNFLSPWLKEGEFTPDFDDEIVRGSCLMREGEIMHEPTAQAMHEDKP